MNGALHPEALHKENKTEMYLSNDVRDHRCESFKDLLKLLLSYCYDITEIFGFRKQKRKLSKEDKIPFCIVFPQVRLFVLANIAFFSLLCSLILFINQSSS